MLPPCSRLSLPALAITACLAGGAHAGNTWDGGGADGKWSTAANWDGDTLPSASSLLQFGGSSQLASTNDLLTATGGFQFNSGAGPFVITGTGVQLAGNVTNNSASLQTIDLPLALASAVTIDAASGPITLGGALSGAAGMSLAKNGGYALTLSNSTTSTFGGTLTVNAGTLHVLGNVSNGGAATVGPAATLSGTGTLGRAVTSTGTVSPGVGGTGTLTIGKASLPATTTTLSGYLTSTGNNKLVVNGDLALGNPAAGQSPPQLNFNGLTVPGTSAVVAEYTGTVTGSLSAQLNYLVEYHGGTSGKQILVMLPEDSYWYWAYGKGLTLSNLALDQDPDGDGFSNLMEFILGGNPTVRSAGLAPTLTLDTTNAVLHFTRTDDFKTYAGHPTVLKVQWSTDLAQWNDIVIPDNISGPGPVTTVRTTLDTISVAIPRSNAANGHLFVRLAATRNP